MLQTLLDNLFSFACLCLTAQGLALAWRTNVFSLGSYGFCCLGAYVAVAVVKVVPQPVIAASPLVKPLVFVLTLAASTLTAAATAYGVCELLRRTRSDYFAIATLAFAESLRIVIENTPWLGAALGSELPYLLIARGYSPITYKAIFACAAFCLLLGAMYFVSRLDRDVIGRQIDAIREDETTAAHLGIDTNRLRREAFIFSATTAAIAGSLTAHFYAFVVPSDFTFATSIPALLFVVIGGYRVGQTFVASAALYVLYELVKSRFFGWCPEQLADQLRSWQESFYGLLLIVSVILLFGHSCRRRVIRRNRLV